MAEFLVELYAPRSDEDAVELDSQRARRAADELARQGLQVRFVRSVFVPEDETCFYLYEASSAGNARRAAQRAGLRVDRVTEAISDRRELWDEEA